MAVLMKEKWQMAFMARKVLLEYPLGPKFLDKNFKSLQIQAGVPARPSNFRSPQCRCGLDLIPRFGIPIHSPKIQRSKIYTFANEVN
jgi:hypothetical protein